MKNFVHVRPMLSDRSHKAVANQYAIVAYPLTMFQSYDSLIAVYDREANVLTLGRDWDYSVTTMKYLWKFLQSYCGIVWVKLPDGRSGADRIRKAIKQGLIQYDENMV